MDEASEEHDHCQEDQCASSGGDDTPVNEEYLEFIRITRQHQAERQKQKSLKLKKNRQSLDLDEYYIDISQVNTVIEANLAEVPEKGKQITATKEEDLIRRYGTREAYDKIRSMEMNIDDHFKRKCQQSSAHYWPVIPINPKPYLNPMRN